MVANAYRLQPVYSAAFFYSLDKERGAWTQIYHKTESEHVKVQTVSERQIHFASVKLSLNFWITFPEMKSQIELKAVYILFASSQLDTDISCPFIHLNECISSSIVCDGETQSIFCLCHLHFFRLPSDVSEDEVLQSNLSPQQLLHVHFMGVQGAEKNLKGHKL